jgi:hypothetical protein
MQRNLLILRASPDWLNFDMAGTRDFLRPFALPENLIIEFAALWNSHFKIDYRTLRAQLKALALQTYSEVRQAALLRHEEWDGEVQQAGWVAFVDDDDWMSPELFEALPPPSADQDGARWGSLRVGRSFTANGYAEPVVQARALDLVVYTNNYAVTGRALRRFGRSAVFEHDAAQRAFDRSDFAVVASERYLSCAVKHPCCTMSIRHLMSLECFRADPRRELRDFMQSIDAVCLGDLDHWLRKPFARFREMMGDAIQPG